MIFLITKMFYYKNVFITKMFLLQKCFYYKNVKQFKLTLLLYFNNNVFFNKYIRWIIHSI